MINVITYAIDVRAGAVMSLATFVYIILMLSIAIKYNSNVTKRLIDFGSAYSLVQRQMLKEMDVPYGLIDENGKILWTNNQFDTLFEKSVLNKNIMNIFEGIKPEYLVFDDEKPNHVKLSYKDKLFAVTLTKFELKNDYEDSALNLLEENSGQLISIYLRDETLISKLEKETKEERLVTANIYIDNYDEVVQSVENTRRTLLVALIDRKINVYFSQYDGIVRKLENDKYFVVFKTKYISKMQTNKFAILDEVKTVNIGNSLPVTISIGIGMGGNSLVQNYDLSTTAIDMALGRGGDQAVLKDGSKVYYYGGKTKSVEKNTKVKSRVKATAFRDLIETKDNLYIMGHHIGDNDSFGAAIGLYRVGKTIGKKTHIVLGDVSGSVVPLVDEFKNSDSYDEDMFITGPEAVSEMTKNDALIIVDCNRASYTEYPELVRRAQCIIVFDHHRRSSDTITGAVLSYVDPYASSACEMVTEMIQYVDDGIKLKAFEADALYAGISIDTDGFNSKSGPRTFEAAAFLRRHGADVTRVRKMLRNDMNEYKAIASAVSKSEVYKSAFAITVFDGEGLESPTIGGAKAANQLLDISGIKASFVITQYEDKLYISARSIDEVNVQLVMEKLGGGGHMSIAGAQLTNCTIQQAVNTIKLTLDNMLAEGEI